MSGIRLPENLGSEIDQLEQYIADYKSGKMDATELKVKRVPFGVYEQREADTYMLRVRCAGGTIGSKQLKRVAELAREFGNGIVHLTTRQEIQIHKVSLSNLVPALRELQKYGLSTRGGGGNTVRNIAASVGSGISKDGVFDVTPYALELTSRLIAEKDSWDLPRKYKISFSDSEKDTAHAAVSDLGFIAREVNGVKGFEVFIAGGLGARSRASLKLSDFVPENEVYRIAKAVKELFKNHGNRKNRHQARLRFLLDKVGVEQFKILYQAEYDKLDAVQPLDLSGQQKEPVAFNPSGKAAALDEAFMVWKSEHVVEQRQKGLYMVRIPVWLGELDAEKALKIAEYIEQDNSETLRFTPDQNIVLRNVSEKGLPVVFYFVQKNLGSLETAPLLTQWVSCTGASTCKLGICLSRNASDAVKKRLLKTPMLLEKAAPLEIHVSGCPNSCGQHGFADIGFSGTVIRKEGRILPGYQVWLGGGTENGTFELALPSGEVPARDLPEFVEKLITAIDTEGIMGLKKAYLRSKGKEIALAIASELSRKIPDFDEDKNYYYDWGSPEPFSLAGRSAGECAASMFDIIERDKAIVEKAVAALRETRPAPGSEPVKKLFYHAARMLLIARGVETSEEKAVYQEFVKQFLDTGIADESFRPVVLKAAAGDVVSVTEAVSLAEEVLCLYEKMDERFQFQSVVKKGQTAEDKPAQPVRQKDLRGVACPMNFVKTKMELSKMAPGERLEVWLDGGEPIENVPGSVKAEGHIVLSQTQGNGYWSLLIQKAGGQ